MDAYVCTGPGNIERRAIEPPKLLPGHAIVKIRRIGICGTDIHALEGNQPFFQYPRILGHELAADLVEADKDCPFVPGEPVTLIPYYSCGHCIACRSGRPNCCERLAVCGVHIDGGMSEYLSVPAGALVHARGLGYDELALAEPLAIGAHAIERAGVRPGENVLVIGAGPIGLACMLFAKIAGARLMAMDLSPHRLRFCKSLVQPDALLDGGSEALDEELKELTHGEMPSLLVDATGSQHAINHAFRWMAHGGRYVLVGLQKGEVRFSHPEFHKREGTLMSSRNATRSDFDRVLEAIGDGKINARALVTHRSPFARIETDFRNWLDPSRGIIKTLIEADA